MLLAGSVSLILQYYCNKYMIIRWFRKPPAYTGYCNIFMLQMCEYACIWHCCFSLWIYSVTDVFPDNCEVLGLDLISPYAIYVV